MSDSKLRDLEKVWREGGSLEDEIAWHAERLRLGELEEDRLRLAAAFGRAAACELVGVEDRPLRKLPLPRSPQTTYSWQLPLEVTQRCLVAALAAPPWREVANGALAAAVRAIEAWVYAPGTSVEALRSSTSRAAIGPDPFVPRTEFEAELSGVLLSLGEEWEPGSFSLDSQPPVLAALDTLALVGSSFPYEAIEAELSLWLLGISDPLRERVEGA